MSQPNAGNSGNQSTSACGGVGFVPDPPRTWPRAQGNNCPNCASNYGYQVCSLSPGRVFSTYELDQRRKVEILKYKKNSAQMSRAQQYSMASRNALTRKKAWATQTQTYTNPNVDNLPEVQIPMNGVISTVGLQCNLSNDPCGLTSGCDVPGPVIPLCFDPSVPLYNYKPQITYSAGDSYYVFPPTPTPAEPTWQNYGNSQFVMGAVYPDSNGFIWCADANSGAIRVMNNTMTTVLFNFSVSGDGNQQPTGYSRVYCFLQIGTYMFIGGGFDRITGQSGPTSTNLNPCVSRFDISVIGNYTISPLYSSTSTAFGVYNYAGTTVGTGVYCMENLNGDLICGGTFYGTNSGINCNNLVKIANPTGATGSQTYTELGGGVGGGSNYGAVNSLLCYNSSSTLFVGGNFTSVGVNTTPQSFQYLAVYNAGSWSSAASNSLGGGVSCLSGTPFTAVSSFPYLFVSGSFTMVSGSNNTLYVDGSSPNTFIGTGLGLTSPLPNKCAFNDGSNLLVNAVSSNVYNSMTNGIWTSLGTPYSAADASPRFIGEWNGNYKAASANQTYIRTYQ